MTAGQAADQLSMLPEQDWPQTPHRRTEEGRCEHCGLDADLCTGLDAERYERAQEFIRRFAVEAKSGWRFAKTMPGNPHEYGMVQWTKPTGRLRIEWWWFIGLLRKHGYKRKFAGRSYAYLNIETDGVVRRYWTIDGTGLNRTPVTDEDREALRKANA